MTNQAQGRKKSLFPVQTSVLSGGAFDYVVSGVNYSITFANLLSELGATGTMQQEGAVTGTPVLDVQGSVNGIRNVEPGFGIQTSVSAENGLAISHNFQLDVTGAALSDDFSVASPIFRSLVAGDGIAITAVGDEIEIAQSVTPLATKTIVVNDLADLPTPVGGIITLADDTEYLFNNDVSIVLNRFVVGSNTVISGADSIVTNITYTGSGTMFTSVNKTWTAKNVTLTCTAGTFIDFTGTGVEIFQLLSSVVNADTLGTIDDIAGIHFDDNQLTTVTNGLLFGGTNGVILMESTLATTAAGVVFDLDSATFSAFSCTDGFFTLNGASIFLSGAASSANIDVGSLGSVHNCRFFGTGTPLQTINSFDLRWEFQINSDIQDTHQDCLVSLSGNVTETVIAVAGTPVLVAGTWDVSHASQFTGDANGRCTYDGDKDIHIDVTISFSSAPASGSNKIIGHYAAKNGTVIDSSEAKNNLSAGDLSRTTVLWRILMQTGDYIESFVENETDAVNVVVTDAVLRVS